MPMNKLAERRAAGQLPEDVPPTQEELLTEIRDLLAAQKNAS
jgi:large conductance mechanosensitive channel